MTDTQSTPLLDTLAAMTAASVEETTLDAQQLMLVRLAALAAVDAPEASYLLNIGPAADAGLTVETAQAVLTAVAPIIGAPRTVSAAGKIVRSLGLAIALAEAALDESAEVPGQRADSTS
jgi:alkylhydroperoxidase/carboxymuconolactone decarboxylase family protein YurZ